MTGLLSRVSQMIAPGAAPGKASTSGPPADPGQAAAAVALGCDLLHAVEQFVVSTPDLDTDRFVQRVRGTAAGLGPKVDRPTLDLYRGWVQKALPAFARLQRRALVERHDELWRLAEAYSRAVSVRQRGDERLVDAMHASHHRLREAAKGTDLQTVRAQIQDEINRARAVAETKLKQDREHLAALAAEVSRLESELAAVRGKANYDLLTGLLHRGALDRELQELFAQGKPCALAMLDLDDFKTINDTLGHPIGDRLVVLAAEQLKKASRSVDIVGRFGGDEYCFIAPGVTAEQLANRLTAPLARRHVRVEFDERLFSVLFSVSGGVAATAPGDTPETLLERADRALRAAKAAGKGGMQVAAPLVSGN